MYLLMKVMFQGLKGEMKEGWKKARTRAMATKPGGRPGPEGGQGLKGSSSMRLDSCDGSVLTNEGNAPRPEGRDERRVEGKDWAMAAKPEGRPRPEGRPGMRLDS